MEHTCQLFLNQKDKFPAVKPLTFKNVWITWCDINKHTPKSKLYMDSMATITAERARHAAFKYWWIIHPFSYGRYILNVKEKLNRFLYAYFICIYVYIYMRKHYFHFVQHNMKIFRFLWDTFMMAIYVIAFFTIPFMICFVIMDYEFITLDRVNIPIYTICWLDITFNCITGYYDYKNMSVELKPTKIFM